MLDGLGFLDLRLIPVPRGEVSSIAPTPWFARKVVEAGVKLSDFGRDATRRWSCSRATRARSRPGGRKGRHAELTASLSTTPTLPRPYRDAIRHLNRFLSEADIDFLDDGQEPRIDPFDRTLRRRFVLRPGQDQRFDQSGRLYGGFWQNLKTARRRHIRINGEPVVEQEAVHGPLNAAAVALKAWDGVEVTVGRGDAMVGIGEAREHRCEVKDDCRDLRPPPYRRPRRCRTSRARAPLPPRRDT